MVKKVGFIGLGLMGQPMAEKILLAGYSLAVWNRTAEKCKALCAQGAVLADSPKTIAKHAEIIFMCLTDEVAVDQVLFGEKGVSRAEKINQIVVDHSTLPPCAIVPIFRKMKASHRSYIDAPVTGSVPGVKNGTLVVFAGGDESAVEKVRPILHSYAAQIHYMGGSSLGQATKMCNQTLLINSILAICEMIDLAKKQNLNLDKLLCALKGGLADSKIFQILSKSIVSDQEKLAHIRDVSKDLQYVLNTGKRVDSKLILTNKTAELVDELVTRGLGGEDIKELMQLYDCHSELI